jgi:ATP-dependent RNA helicase RhlE
VPSGFTIKLQNTVFGTFIVKFVELQYFKSITMSFESLNLIEPIQKALATEGYTTPTPIQAQAIPTILQGTDLLGVAQTGTGKTAAFAIPILQLLYKNHTFHKGKRGIKALIITPTRELAIQIDESFQAYGKFTGLTHTVIFGGVKQGKQTEALQNGVDILVATPGRLLDLINQRFISLKDIQLFVLDEADRMLDMGFVHDIKKILAILPQKRQSLFFSATMPPDIQKLADSILYKPVKVEVTPVSSTADTIKQSVYFVDKDQKNALLMDILQDKTIETALVFTRTKHGADKVVKILVRNNIKAEAIHGNKAQNARQRALDNFKSKTTRVLVATDIAARGIDVDDLAYVHRIGRTGRAGANGSALSFCDIEERPFLKDIQKLIAKNIPVVHDHAYPVSAYTPSAAPANKPASQHNRSSSKPNEANKGKKVWFKKK